MVRNDYFSIFPVDGKIHTHIASFLQDDLSSLESLAKVDKLFNKSVRSLRIPIERLSREHDVILEGNPLSRHFTEDLELPDDSVIVGSGWGRAQIFKMNTPVWQVVCLWIGAKQSELDPNIDDNNIGGRIKSRGPEWRDFIAQSLTLPTFTMRSDDTRTLWEFEASLNLPARVVWYQDTISKAPHT